MFGIVNIIIIQMIQKGYLSMKYKMFAVKDVHTGYLAPTLEINENVADVVGFEGVIK